MRKKMLIPSLLSLFLLVSCNNNTEPVVPPVDPEDPPVDPFDSESNKVSLTGKDLYVEFDNEFGDQPHYQTYVRY